ncbi:MAG: homoserine dehydrogenase [Chloroflexota bacterium]
MPTTRQIRLLLIGAGQVGRRFVELLIAKDETLRRLGLQFTLAGIADSGGAAIRPGGLDLAQVVHLKTQGQSVADTPRWGRPGMSALEMVRTVNASLMLDASPADLQEGQPGMACTEAALIRGLHVVTANKAPLALAFSHLLALAEQHGVQLRFDATVAGGLPAVNLGQRDLAAAEILRLEGLLNLTANYILTRMAQEGLSYDDALAQAAGHAETDPRLDVEGWDAANKLVILANSVLGFSATLADVTVEGITGITADVLRQASAQGQRIKLVAAAERQANGYHLSVRPTWLDAEHPLARLGPAQMAICYHTDIMGIISATILEETPLPTAAAMLRDVIQIYRCPQEKGWN